MIANKKPKKNAVGIGRLIGIILTSSPFMRTQNFPNCFFTALVAKSLCSRKAKPIVSFILLFDPLFAA